MGGSGGGGDGINGTDAVANPGGQPGVVDGDDNTGGGGGSSWGWGDETAQAQSGVGGSGVVILRYKTA